MTTRRRYKDTRGYRHPESLPVFHSWFLHSFVPVTTVASVGWFVSFKHTLYYTLHTPKQDIFTTWNLNKFQRFFFTWEFK